MAKYIYNGKMSEMDFSVHHKYSPKKIIKFKKIILRFSEIVIMLRLLYFRITSNKNLTHETKLAYALSFEQPYIYNIHLTCNSTNWQWHKCNKSGFTSLELWKHSRIWLSKHIQRFLPQNWSTSGQDRKLAVMYSVSYSVYVSLLELPWAVRVCVRLSIT